MATPTSAQKLDKILEMQSLQAIVMAKLDGRFDVIELKIKHVEQQQVFDKHNTDKQIENLTFQLAQLTEAVQALTTESASNKSLSKVWVMIYSGAQALVISIGAVLVAFWLREGTR